MSKGRMGRYMPSFLLKEGFFFGGDGGAPGFGAGAGVPEKGGGGELVVGSLGELHSSLHEHCVPWSEHAFVCLRLETDTDTGF